jgi:hypothetical protein
MPEVQNAEANKKLKHVIYKLDVMMENASRDITVLVQDL